MATITKFPIQLKPFPVDDATLAWVSGRLTVVGGSGGGSVVSVAGRTGAITLTPPDVGLGSVANVPPAGLPVSTAQAAALALKADKLTSPSDVPGLAAILAVIPRVYTAMPAGSVGSDGDVGILSAGGTASLIVKSSGTWVAVGGASGQTVAPVRMNATGTFRNGPGIYSGLTVVSGSGAISVYDGPDATSLGRLVHSIPSASAGAYTVDAEPITNGWIVLGSGLVVDINVDD